MEQVTDRYGRVIGRIYDQGGDQYIAKDLNGRTLATYHGRTDVTVFPDGHHERGDKLMRCF